MPIYIHGLVKNKGRKGDKICNNSFFFSLAFTRLQSCQFLYSPLLIISSSRSTLPVTMYTLCYLLYKWKEILNISTFVAKKLIIRIINFFYLKKNSWRYLNFSVPIFFFTRTIISPVVPFISPELIFTPWLKVPNLNAGNGFILCINYTWSNMLIDILCCT